MWLVFVTQQQRKPQPALLPNFYLALLYEVAQGFFFFAKVPVCKIVDFRVSIEIVKYSHFGFPG